MQPTAETQFQVPFHDVDMLEVAWHGHYFKYFEYARTELFRAHDFDMARIKELGYRIVVSDSGCRYIRPLLYGMNVVARATLTEHEYYLMIRYTLFNKEDGKRLARGFTKHVTLTQNNELIMETPKDILDVFGVSSNDEETAHE